MNIFFFGDSICFGQGISLHKGWVARLSKNIEKIANNKRVRLTVINSAINGNTTRLALERMPYDVQSHGIGIIVIQFGMNDCNLWKSDKGLPRVSPLAFEANLKEIINRSLKFGAKKIFLNTNHPTTRTKKISYAGISYEENNQKYNQIIRAVSNTSSKVILNDVGNYIDRYLEKNKLNVSDVIMEDGLHINLKGHDLYYKFVGARIVKEIEGLL